MRSRRLLALAAIDAGGPDLERHGVVRWPLKDLVAWTYADFGVSLDESSVGRVVDRVDNIWPFIRENWLGDRIFASSEDIRDPCCLAWNRLVDQPWTIMSIGPRECAYRLSAMPIVLSH